MVTRVPGLPLEGVKEVMLGEAAVHCEYIVKFASWPAAVLIRVPIPTGLVNKPLLLSSAVDTLPAIKVPILVYSRPILAPAQTVVLIVPVVIVCACRLMAKKKARAMRS
jgi:hypothetical protein